MSKRSARNAKAVKRKAEALARKISNPPLTTDGATANPPGTLPTGTLLAMSREVSYSGPVPPPMMLQQYDFVEPGRAAKIMQLAEDQSRHRMALESRVIHSDIRRSWTGMVLGGFICLCILAVGGWLVYNDHDTAGASIVTATIVGVAGVFVYGRESQKKERVEKAKIMSGKKK